jgi:hypothetical protein
MLPQLARAWAGNTATVLVCCNSSECVLGPAVLVTRKPVNFVCGFGFTAIGVIMTASCLSSDGSFHWPQQWLGGFERTTCCVAYANAPLLRIVRELRCYAALHLFAVSPKNANLSCHEFALELASSVA